VDPARWEQVQAIFHAALERPAGERRALVAAEAAGDAALISDVLALLEEDGAPSLLDHGLAEVAREVLDDGVPPGLRAAAFGPYRILHPLGEGGMGVVYLARRADLGSVAALKILRDAWLSPARRERFAGEQRTLAQLDHPAIARLYDADTLPDGTPWFVMEYVEGMPLTDHCRAHRCTIAERLRLFRDICEAVQHAHLHATIHRDLKPSNILVKADGSVKLLDFGIAKQIAEGGAPVDQTRTGLRLMTPAYAAPEQIRGDPVGLHTDVYSLGIMLYELLTGRLPFDLARCTPAEAVELVAASDPVRPSAVARAAQRSGDGPADSVGRPAWADLDVLCLTAMHKDPARRYRTVEALMRDVDRYLAGEPLEARPDTLRYRAGKFVRRNRRAVVAAGAVLATVVGLVVFYTVRLARARDEAVAEVARTERIQRFMLNLFRGGDEALGPADSLRVLTLLDRGADEARALDRDPTAQSDLRLTLGGLYQKLGNFGRADTLLRAALDQRRRFLDPAAPGVAEALVALGLLRADEARLEEAERLVREGLAMDRRTLPPDHPAVLAATAALGRVLQERGSYPEAIALQEDVVRRRAAADSATPDLAASLSDLAGTHFYAGHLAQSDSINRQVLEMSRRLHGPRHPLVAEDLINLGAAQFERGEYAAAERYYREALGISRPWYGERHPKTAAHLTMLGRALVYQGRHAEADTLLREALTIRERVYGPMHPVVASTLNELSNIAYLQARYDDAEQLTRRMVDIYRTAYRDRHYLIGIATSNLANIYLAKQELPRAEAMFREAVRRFSDAQGPDHMNTGIGRIKLGRTLLRERRFAEAVVESRAGYAIVRRQASPGVSFLQAARKDLVAAYDSLGEPAKAARFRAELADTLAK
jgi:tetratricopeptide (TPR) repeat protein